MENPNNSEELAFLFPSAKTEEATKDISKTDYDEEERKEKVAKLHAANKLINENIEDIQQNRGERKLFARWIFQFIVWYMAFVGFVLILSGIVRYNRQSFSYQRQSLDYVAWNNHSECDKPLCHCRQVPLSSA